MYSAEANDVELIDFEYATRTSIGYDIANLFNSVPESCLAGGGLFDVDHYYPTQSVQRRWLQAYFSAREIDIDDDVMAELLILLAEFCLVSESRWVIWYVVQGGYSPADFDYLGYGITRFEQGVYWTCGTSTIFSTICTS